ncbi:hypothetical protein PG990_011818 [Apiospora arundinis]
MGNTISSPFGLRSCGLCYFKLPAGTPFLDQPAVSRKVSPTWPQSKLKEGRLDDVLRPKKDILNVVMKTTLSAIKASAKRGCVGCEAILKCLESQVGDHGFVLDETSWADQCTLTWLVGNRKSNSPSLFIEVKVPATIDGLAKHRAEQFSMMLGYTGDKFVHPAARKVSPAVALGKTGSPGSLQPMKTWLDNCAGSHQSCKAPAYGLPHRLVELSKDARGETVFRLVQGLQGQEAYACLSHQWVKSTENCRTTKQTLVSHLKQIPTKKLTTTFREAGEVTLYLGLKYLWIDSLCIIQDDTEDWKVQAAQMCDIYNGSYVTIAATSGDRLFHTVPKTAIRPVGPARDDLFIRQTTRHSLEFQPTVSSLIPVDYPLLTRGWVFQERLLSPRLLHFTRYEIMFECSSRTSQCECGPGAYNVWEGKPRHQMTVSSGSTQSPYDVRLTWKDLISHYTALNLTYASDSIPALAGIARQYGTQHRDVLGRYVAGLWEHSLVTELMWHVVGTASTTSARPAASPAPSWSWASVTGKHEQLAFPRTSETDFEIVSFEVELAGADEFGPLEHAEMTVRGFLATGTWKTARRPGTNTGTVTLYRPDAGAGTAEYEMHPDYNYSSGDKGSQRLEEGSQVFCMKMGHVGAGFHTCLILRALNEELTDFARIGLLQMAPREDVESWYEDGQAAEKKTFRLL